MFQHGATMAIRKATLDDISEIIRLGTEGFESENRSANLESIAEFTLDHVTAQNKLCLVVEGKGRLNGVICAVIGPHFLNGQMTVWVVGWYVEPKFRGFAPRLLRRCERWGSQNGANNLVVAARLERAVAFLEKSGYTPLELIMQKAI